MRNRVAALLAASMLITTPGLPGMMTAFADSSNWKVTTKSATGTVTVGVGETTEIDLSNYFSVTSGSNTTDIWNDFDNRYATAESSDKNVATVGTSNGILFVNGVKAGSCTIKISDLYLWIASESDSGEKTVNVSITVTVTDDETIEEATEKLEELVESLEGTLTAANIAQMSDEYKEYYAETIQDALDSFFEKSASENLAADEDAVEALNALDDYLVALGALDKSDLDDTGIQIPGIGALLSDFDASKDPAKLEVSTNQDELQTGKSTLLSNEGYYINFGKSHFMDFTLTNQSGAEITRFGKTITIIASYANNDLWTGSETDFAGSANILAFHFSSTGFKNAPKAIQKNAAKKWAYFGTNGFSTFAIAEGGEVSTTTTTVRRGNSGGGGGSSSGGGSVSGSSAAAGSSTTSRPATPGSWAQREDGAWVFMKEDGTPWQETWIVYGQQWYYVDAQGVCQTGWQILNGVYYYFSAATVEGQPLGSLYMNKTTPDGYTVDANGAWVQ